MSKAINLKAVLLSAAMIGGAYAAHLAHPNRMLVDELPPLVLAKEIPQQIGDWRLAPDLGNKVVNPQTQELLDSLYSETLTRTYVNSAGKAVMLSIAYGKNQSDDKAVHYPEVCYPAQGFAITARSTGSLSLSPDEVIPAKRLVAKRGSTFEPITYWVTVGDRVTLTGMQHKIAQLGYGFNGIIPDGMIFRVSSIGDSIEDEYKVQDDFARSLAKAVAPTVYPRVFGATSSR